MKLKIWKDFWEYVEEISIISNNLENELHLKNLFHPQKQGKYNIYTYLFI
jgi:hypothetical protein